MLITTVYPIFMLIATVIFGAFFALLLLRLIFNITDPNPFGAVGRFGFRIRKITESSVYPSMRLLANFNINPKWAPIVTMIFTFAIYWFATGVVGNTLYILDGFSRSISTGNVKAIIGWTLYAALSIFVLLLLIRFISSWFVFTRNTFLDFVTRVTDPVLVPLRRLIPPIGMFDISAMILLIVIQLLQSFIFNTLIR